MAQSPKDVIDASELIKAAWKKFAPTATFSGMTLAQYTTKIQPSSDLRSQIGDHETAIAQLIPDRDLVDVTTNQTNQSVIKELLAM
jgi:hypothetical protein